MSYLFKSINADADGQKSLHKDLMSQKNDTVQLNCKYSYTFVENVSLSVNGPYSNATI